MSLVDIQVTNTDWDVVTERDTFEQANGGSQSNVSFVIDSPVVQGTVEILVPDDQGGYITIVDNSGNLDEQNGASNIGNISYSDGSISSLDLSSLTSATVASSGAILVSFEWQNPNNPLVLPESLGSVSIDQNNSTTFTLRKDRLDNPESFRDLSPTALLDLKDFSVRGDITYTVTPNFADVDDDVLPEVESAMTRGTLGVQRGEDTVGSGGSGTKTVSLPNSFPDADYHIDLTRLSSNAGDGTDNIYVSARTSNSFDVSTNDGAAPTSDIDFAWRAERS